MRFRTTTSKSATPLRRQCRRKKTNGTNISGSPFPLRVKPAPKGSADGKPEQSPFPLSEKELREVATVFLCEEHLLYPVGDDAWAAKLPSDVLLLLRAMRAARHHEPRCDARIARFTHRIANRGARPGLCPPFPPPKFHRSGTRPMNLTGFLSE